VTEPEEPSADQPAAVSEQQTKEVLSALEGARPVDDLPPYYEQEKREREQDITLKRWYAISLLLGLGAQIAIVDVVLVFYAWKGVHWHIEPLISDVWLGATVVEVIAVVLVVTQHLFPSRGAIRPASGHSG
jgi:hypothetical protein